MTVFERAVMAYLAAHGSTPQPALYNAIVQRDMLSVKTFHKRLVRMLEAGHIVNTSPTRAQSVWQIKAKRTNVAPDAQPLKKRHHSVMDAPPMAAIEMIPARAGVANHTLYASRRGDEFVPHQQPIHMCSGLSGGMK